MFAFIYPIQSHDSPVQDNGTIVTDSQYEVTELKEDLCKASIEMQESGVDGSFTNPDDEVVRNTEGQVGGSLADVDRCHDTTSVSGQIRDAPSVEPYPCKDELYDDIPALKQGVVVKEVPPRPTAVSDNVVISDNGNIADVVNQEEDLYDSVDSLRRQEPSTRTPQGVVGDGERSANGEDPYDRVAIPLQRNALLKGITDAEDEQDSSSGNLPADDEKSADEEFTETRVADDSPWRRTKPKLKKSPRRERIGKKNNNSFEFFQPMFPKREINEESKADTKEAVEMRTKPDLIRDRIGAAADQTRETLGNMSHDDVEQADNKRLSHNYMNVDVDDHKKLLGEDVEGTSCSDVNSDRRPVSEVLYEDITLENVNTSLVESTNSSNVSCSSLPLPAIPSEDGAQHNRHSGISMASESSTASYIEIEEEILSKLGSERSAVTSLASGGSFVSASSHISATSSRASTRSKDTSKEEVVLKSSDDFNLVSTARVFTLDESTANTTTSEVTTSDDDAIMEKSSSSSEKDQSGEDSDTIYANIIDEAASNASSISIKVDETEEDDDIMHLPETELTRGVRSASAYAGANTTYDESLRLKVSTVDDPDAPRIYQRPESLISKNSYLSLLEDFSTMDRALATMDREHASYYISDDKVVGGILADGDYGDFDKSLGKWQNKA